ncbi:uncharacterized protein NECHADRAFT_33154 [Fusarium vanettenii 77-13-4]|uniref:Uncharacterized protein n=1 Tax=Fusarium vanettenii (strain ATCC MYA-4622 / CBS 123669 / FGSC 9596 / NRRL 45880 / 77-13-4) TaxID=660122 RepID=C7Z5Z6_FUSV7|nr:uncharacterized protein NECHADRAFT_33154 [Fusarium vanettenii 77-13-4]EEU40609.1 hypothetical protein NECHADRAFT_33154 [Fusarium vanettenii 77-13-4]
MIESSSSFIASSIPLLHNAVKSLIFKCAEILMALFIWKLFSLFAARSRQFTAYLMFAEDYVQRLLFLSSRGFSRATLLVLGFSLLNVAASLYGTLLWALDSPGYIFRQSDTTAAEYAHLSIKNPPYIVQLHLDPDSLDETNATLSQVVGSELFQPGLNYTLTGDVRRGTPEITTPTRQDDVGARIWLDDTGFSVSPDSYAMLPETSTIDGQAFPSCTLFRGGSAAWNCTFNNTFSVSIINTVVGLPEVHWDDASDLKLDSRYVKPNRIDNIWASFGAGGGSAVMMQVFSVTKGTRRHTFVESVLRVTILTSPGIPFAEKDVDNLVRRTWSTNETERKDPLIDKIVGGMMRAQDEDLSFQFGANTVVNSNLTALQSNWGYLTAVGSNDKSVYSLVSITSTNITLIRSETLDKAPSALEKCDQGSFQNEAFGGKVTQTDCAASTSDDETNKFFGQVDTAAVLIAYGLGNGRSNVSSESLNEDVLSWTENTSATLENLLVARAYMVSIDPSSVTINVQKLMVAMSGLQLLLSALAAVLAGVAWLALSFLADAYWSNTFLASVMHTTLERSGKRSGYVQNPQNVELLSGNNGDFIAVAGRAVVLQDRPSDGFLAQQQWMAGNQPVAYYSQVPTYADPNIPIQQTGHNQPMPYYSPMPTYADTNFPLEQRKE